MEHQKESYSASRNTSCSMRIRPAKAMLITAVLAGLAWARPSIANAEGSSTTISFLSSAPKTTILASQISMSPVTPASTTITFDWAAQNVSATLAADITYTSTVVTQTISSIWTATSFKTTNSLAPAYSAAYSVNGSGSSTGYFYNAQDPTSSIKVTLTPNVQQSSTGTGTNTRYTLIASLDLAFDFTTVKRSGDYTGTIKCTITPTNF